METSSGIVRALVLTAERQQPRQPCLKVFRQRMPLVGLRDGRGVRGERGQQVFLQHARRGKSELGDQFGQVLLHQPAQALQTAVGGLRSEELPARRLTGP
ncbi:hypothetical protein [Streptomyces sp. NPDC059894]|uniref:hypothetical protein n=1 Tax=unclassified Streptomyces TaxID=2593676 RepID=UPI003657A912